MVHQSIDHGVSAGTIVSSEVAVGTALSGGPPHRSGPAELPYPALTSGVWHRSVKVDLVLFPCHAVDSRCCHALERVKALLGTPVTPLALCSRLQPAQRSCEASAACGGVSPLGPRIDHRTVAAAPTAGRCFPAWRIRVELATETHTFRGRRLQPAFPACSNHRNFAVPHVNGQQSQLTEALHAKMACAESV
jgi:hypothetical protein